MDLVKVEHLKDERLTIFARSRETGEKLQIILKGFNPYFYIHHGDPAPTNDLVSNVELTKVPALGGELLQKITLKDPMAIRRIRDGYIRTWEADVPYTQRAIIDLGITPVFDIDLGRKAAPGLRYASADTIRPTEQAPKTGFHKTYYDYEMAMERFEGPEKAGAPIINGGFINAWEKKAYSFIWHKRTERRVEHTEFYSQTLDDFMPWEVRWYENEQDMLVAIVQHIANSDPDSLIGFNSSGSGKRGGDHGKPDYGFDHPYFVNRCAGLGIDVNHMSPVGKVSDVNCRGRHLLDIQRLWEEQQANKLRDKTLKTIAAEATKDMPSPVKLLKDPGKITDWWHSDPDSLLAYNMRDVDATWAVDVAKDVTAWVEEYWMATKVDDMMDVLSASVVSDVLHLEQSKGVYILPTRPDVNSQGTKYEGALVIHPEEIRKTSGVDAVLDMVGVLDFSKMYPTNFIAGNISYETYDPDHGVRLPGGHHFRQNPEGLTPLAVKRLFKLREHYDKLIKSTTDPQMKKFYKKKRQPIKDTINAFYGTMGYRKFRLFRTQCAETVTAMGRYLLDLIRRVAGEFGFLVVYGDTDSIFLWKKNFTGSLRDFVDDMEALQEYINSVILIEGAKNMNVTEGMFKVEFEKVFGRVYLSRSKKYTGRIVYEEGNFLSPEDQYVMTKGFETVRSDSAEVTADMQEWLFEDILNKVERKDIEAKIHDLCRKIVTASLPLSYIAPAPSWGKEVYKNIPIWVRAAENSNAIIGTEFRVGDRIRYIYTKGFRKEDGTIYPVDVLAVPEDGLPEGVIPDLELMADKVVKEKYRKVATDLRWEDAGFELIGTGQKTLNKWAGGSLF